MGPLYEGVINPLPYILLLFIEHLIYTLPCQVNSSSFLVKSFNNSQILVGPLFFEGSHAGNQLALTIAIIRFELDIVKLG